MFGERIPRPALYYVNFRNNVIYIILYYYYYRERAIRFGPLRSCGLCDRIELWRIYGIRCSYLDKETRPIIQNLNLFGAFRVVGLCLACGIYMVVCAMQHEQRPPYTRRAGQAGGVRHKSNKEQTNNALVCSPCPQCNALRGYRVTTGDWYLTIRARRARTPRPRGEHRPLGGYRVTTTFCSTEWATALLP